uniref:YlbE-like protein n=1 Tax=Caenorhabditis tropicalis TaxID=1561998 RepID=A0A1I7V3T5_9PELO
MDRIATRIRLEEQYTLFHRHILQHPMVYIRPLRDHVQAQNQQYMRLFDWMEEGGTEDMRAINEALNYLLIEVQATVNELMRMG